MTMRKDVFEVAEKYNFEPDKVQEAIKLVLSIIGESRTMGGLQVMSQPQAKFESYFRNQVGILEEVLKVCNGVVL